MTDERKNEIEELSDEEIEEVTGGLGRNAQLTRTVYRPKKGSTPQATDLVWKTDAGTPKAIFLGGGQTGKSGAVQTDKPPIEDGPVWV